MSHEKRGAHEPRCIKVNETDNVAIIVNEGGLPAGTAFPDGLTLIDAVPQGHKVALRDIHEGEPIVRYGEVIGYASRALPKGSWVEESSVKLPKAPDLDDVLADAMKQFRHQTDGAPRRRIPAAGNEAASKVDASNVAASSAATFDGYRNPDGSVGSKNILGLIPSVQCVAGVLNVAARRIEQELLPRFPHVDGVVALNHSYGCGVAIGAPDAVIPIRTIRNLTSHPNFGGMPLIVGLGCEKLQPERIVPVELPRAPLLPVSAAPTATAIGAASHTGGLHFNAKPSILGPTIIRLQEEAGFPAMIDTIMRAAEERLALLETRRREPCPLSELVVGLQCGGSDAFSGVTANPAIGYASDLLVRAGATVMFSEVTEVRDAVQLLAPRAASPGVAAALVREMRWYDDYLARGGADRSANPAPGNKKGGLANVVEKALGSSAKSGTSPIVGVLGPGERAPIYEHTPMKERAPIIERASIGSATPESGGAAPASAAPAQGGPAGTAAAAPADEAIAAPRGLYFAATPASDFICGTLQLASGMHLQVFSTGRGTPYGLAMAPVIKVSSNSRLAHQWPNLIDIDAGRIAEGQASIEEVGREIFNLILDVASGRKKPWVDQYRLYNDLVLFNPGPVT